MNHVYADRISGAVAVRCWSPAAGVSIGRGKALWRLPSVAKPCCGGTAGREHPAVCKCGVQWGGKAVGAGGRTMRWAPFDAFPCLLVSVDMASVWPQLSVPAGQGCGHRSLCSPVPPSPGAHGVAWAWGRATCGDGLARGFGVGAAVRAPAECAVASGML